ncbi:MAG: PAS domain-containing protein, partial [Myxococcales bacterium]
RKGGDVVRIHGTVQDITERKRVEGELRDSRERLNLALEAAEEGIWDWDVPSGLTYFSPRYYALLGYGLNDFEASYASWRRMVHPDDVARVADIDRRLSPSTPDYKLDLRMRAKGGDWRWMTVRGKAVAWDPEGRPVRVVGTHTDVVDRKRAEAEREQLIAELEAKNTEMQRFSYAVSHDLKSPLITIRGFLGFLREDVVKNDLAQFEKDITRVSKAVETMYQLLDHLLELSRIGRSMRASEDVSLREVANEAVELVTGRLKQRGVTVTIGSELPVVRGDRGQLRAAFQNLIDNAAKFMGSQREPRIEVGSERRGERSVLFVRDNGMGIDTRFHEQVFGLFHKLDPKSDGTGVGLALVKRIMEAHGGAVWVESAGLGRGATLCFTLAGES